MSAPATSVPAMLALVLERLIWGLARAALQFDRAAVKSSDLILVLIAYLCPPAAVWIMNGVSCSFLLSLFLYMTGYLPSRLHALKLMYKHARADEQRASANAKLGWGPPEVEHATPPARIAHQHQEQPLKLAGGSPV